MLYKETVADRNYRLLHPVNFYAWPRGYPLYYITGSNDTLCPTCVSENVKQCADPCDQDWYVVDVEPNYDQCFLYCENCNAHIPPAYKDDTDCDQELE